MQLWSLTKDCLRMHVLKKAHSFLSMHLLNERTPIAHTACARKEKTSDVTERTAWSNTATTSCNGQAATEHHHRSKYPRQCERHSTEQGNAWHGKDLLQRLLIDAGHYLIPGILMAEYSVVSKSIRKQHFKFEYPKPLTKHSLQWSRQVLHTQTCRA